MVSQEDLVKQAIKTGLFKEKTHPKSGRKYYVNTKTKKAVWRITPEMLKGGGGASAKRASEAEPKRDLEEEERQRQEKVQQEYAEQARKRAEAENVLRANLNALERQKEELEEELTRLEGPVEAEIEELEILRRELEDARRSLQQVQKEVETKRKERQEELKRIQDSIVSLQSLTKHEQEHRQAVEQRYNQLVAEGLELRADIQKERNACEALKDAVRRSESKITDAQRQLDQQSERIRFKEEALHQAQEDLKTTAQRKAEVEAEVKQLNEDIVRLNERLERRTSCATESSEAIARQDAAANKVLEELQNQVEAKRTKLAKLQRCGRAFVHRDRLASSNGRLSDLIATFKQDRDKLERLDKFLESQVSQAQQWVLTAKTEALRLLDHLQSLQRNPLILTPSDAKK